MENIKWLMKKYGFYIVLIIMLAMMSIIFGKKNSEKKAEEVWEPPVTVEREEIKTEDEKAEDSVGDLTEIHTGEPVKIEDGLIPAEIYETVMTTFFPVSVEQLRENCGYHTSSNSYESEPIVPAQYPPFGEVVDYAQNPDGTITLYVDCVWPDFNTDCAYKNRIVVQPFEDGTFRYLSNFVEESRAIENITEENRKI